MKAKLIPVIHAVDAPQALRNTEIARTNNADGIFLISHGNHDAHELIQLYKMVRAEHPDYWIGLNLLEMTRSPQQAMKIIPADVNALWVDDAWIQEDNQNPTTFAADIYKKRVDREDWKGIYFGGVAFKYRNPVKDLARVSRLAVPFTDAIVTSGDATGSPPSVKKIRIMREAMGKNHPFANASGITCENIRPYLGLLDYFFVASGISKVDSEFDPELVKKMAGIIHDAS